MEFFPRNVIRITKLATTFDVEEMSASEYASEPSNSAVTVLHDAVVDIDLGRHLITTRGGRKIGYEKLCLCHGARPKILPEAKDNPHVMGIRDTESVRQFQEKLGGSARIVIVGNGGIATELVHELRGVGVIWVVKDDSIAATFVDAGAGEFLLAELNKDKNGDGGEETVTKRMKYTSAAAGNDKVF